MSQNGNGPGTTYQEDIETRAIRAASEEFRGEARRIAAEEVANAVETLKGVVEAITIHGAATEGLSERNHGKLCEHDERFTALEKLISTVDKKLDNHAILRETADAKQEAALSALTSEVVSGQAAILQVVAGLSDASRRDQDLQRQADAATERATEAERIAKESADTAERIEAETAGRLRLISIHDQEELTENRRMQRDIAEKAALAGLDAEKRASEATEQERRAVSHAKRAQSAKRWAFVWKAAQIVVAAAVGIAGTLAIKHCGAEPAAAPTHHEGAKE